MILIPADFRRFVIPDDFMVALLASPHPHLHVQRGAPVDPDLRPMQHHDAVKVANEFWCSELAASMDAGDFTVNPYVGLKKVPGTRGLFKLWMLADCPALDDEVSQNVRWYYIQQCMNDCLQGLRRQHARVVLPAGLVETPATGGYFALADISDGIATLQWSRIARHRIPFFDDPRWQVDEDEDEDEECPLPGQPPHTTPG